MVTGPSIDYFNTISFETVFKIFWKGTLFLGEKFFGDAESVFGIGAKIGVWGPRYYNLIFITLVADGKKEEKNNGQEGTKSECDRRVFFNFFGGTEF